MARPRLSHTFFRTDASFSIGTGHVMRCLTLANELSQKGATIKFICREEPGHMINHIEEQGYQVYRLPSGIDLETDLKLSKGYLEKHSRPIDWLVVDHYDMDIRWESCMRQSVHKIMVIDDMINRVHDCDILLNQNYGFFEEQYQGLVPNHCIQLLGPKYALLRPQFRKVLENLRERDGEVKRILVFMGGADPTNQTCKVLRAIKKLNSPDITVDTVIGASNPNRGEVERLSSEIPNASCHIQIDNMAELMAASDLCIGAGGATTWERCCVRLPTLIVAVAENQIGVVKELSKEGYVIYSGWHKDVTVQGILEDMSFLIRHKEIIKQLYLKSKSLVDGRGVERLENYLLKNNMSLCLRPAVIDDCKRVFEWRNHPNIRKYSFDSSPLSWNEHKQWFMKTISASDVELLIGENDNNPIGVLRYDFKDDKTFVSIYINPELIGMGIGTYMIKIGNNWIKKNHPEIKKIIAEIVHQNISSMKAFQKAGFKDSHMTYVFDLNSNSQ